MYSNNMIQASMEKKHSASYCGSYQNKIFPSLCFISYFFSFSFCLFFHSSTMLPRKNLKTHRHVKIQIRIGSWSQLKTTVFAPTVQQRGKVVVSSLRKVVLLDSRKAWELLSITWAKLGFRNVIKGISSTQGLYTTLIHLKIKIKIIFFSILKENRKIGRGKHGYQGIFNQPYWNK